MHRLRSDSLVRSLIVASKVEGCCLYLGQAYDVCEHMGPRHVVNRASGIHTVHGL